MNAQQLRADAESLRRRANGLDDEAWELRNRDASASDRRLADLELAWERREQADELREQAHRLDDEARAQLRAAGR